MLSLSKGPILNKTQGVFTAEVSSGRLSGSFIGQLFCSMAHYIIGIYFLTGETFFINTRLSSSKEY